jgi:hypothetical protein
VEDRFMTGANGKLQQFGSQRGESDALRREALQPQAVRPQQVVQGRGDRAEEGAAIEAPVRIGKLLARIEQALVEPAVVLGEELVVRDEGVTRAVHAPFCLAAAAQAHPCATAVAQAQA